MKNNFTKIILIGAVVSSGIYIATNSGGKIVGNQKAAQIVNFNDKQNVDDTTKEVLGVQNNVLNSQIVSAEKIKGEQLFYALNNRESFIGNLDKNHPDNPSDNVFQVLLNKTIASKSKVCLEYELYGVADFTSVCKSVNDQLATGGLFVEKREGWSKQSEQLNPKQIRNGKNIIRFAVPENAEYGYKVRNVCLRVKNDINNNDRKLIVNQPNTFTYYQKYGYLQGFVTGKGSEKAKLTVNGKPFRLNNGNFEGITDKSLIDTNAWTATVEAQFEDGIVIKTNVQFDKQTNFDYTNNLSNNIKQTVEPISPKNKIDIKHDGLQIIGDENSINKSTNLTVTTLRAVDMAPMGTGMVNVTGGGKGFRLLPHGTKFNKDLTLRIAYDTTLLPPGYKPSDVRTYYFDETVNRWIAVQRDTVEIASNIIVSATNHFTDYINAIIKTPEMPETQAYTPTSIKDLKAANPLEGYNIIQPPTANNIGTANISFPIEIPAGRQGMQPNLALQYNSGGGNGLLGVGWDLNVPAITIETRWGVPLYSGSMETESYLLNGEELVPITNGERKPQIRKANYEYRQPDKEFALKSEGAFSKIIRHGSSPINYYWTVTDRNGIEYTYGDADESNNGKITDDIGNIAHWPITKMKDVNGNFVYYEHTILYHAGIVGGTITGRQIYLTTITYTNFDGNNKSGYYRVNFDYEQKEQNDIQISGRKGFKEVNAHRLKNIKVFSYKDPVRKYHLVYKAGAFDKTLLCSIIEEDAKSATIGTQINDSLLKCSINNKDFSLITGIKQHTFEYNENVPTAKYTAEETITAYDDELKDRTIFGHPSAIGNVRSWEWGFGVGVGGGLGTKTKKNSLSLCFNYGRSGLYSNGLSTLMDIDGDGLPDKVMYKSEFDYLSFTTDKEVSYRKLEKSGGTYSFGSSNKINGINEFLAEKTITDYFGGDFHVGISDNWAINLAARFSRSNTYTSKYFSDANGDGLIDLVDEGVVFYNKNRNGNNIFESSLSDTVWIGEGHCNYIINSGEIDPNIVAEDPIIKFCDTIHDRKLNKDTIICYDNSNLHEAVRLWIAPRDGNISINSPIKLIEDTSYNRQQSHYVDGVKYRLQKNGADFYIDSIAKDDYNTKILQYNNLAVNRGDRIYFRLQSKTNIRFDNVKWAPTIYYLGKDTNILDADSKPINIFKSSDDLLLSTQQNIDMPLQGSVKIRGSITAPELSDTVVFQIKQNDQIIREEIFYDNTAINYYIEDVFPVDTDDVFVFYLKSNTQVEWSAINSSFDMFYTETTDTNFVLDTTSVFTSVKYKPILQYSLYQDDIKPTVPYAFNTNQTIEVTPYLTFASNSIANGEIVFAIKTKHKIIDKKVLTISGSQITNNQTFTFVNPSTDSIYFEYYVDSVSLANKIKYARVLYDYPNLNKYYEAGLHATVSDTMFIFGNLYRNWGQFCYKPELKIPPIDESKLNISTNFDTTKLLSMDMDTANFSFEHFVAYLKYNKIGNSLTSPFSMMYPDMDSLVWRGSIGFTMVGRYMMSNETNMNSGSILPNGVTDISETTVLFDYPIPKIVPGRRITAPLKKSYTDSFSKSASTGPTILNAGLCETGSETYQITDFMDMNGDRYPDVVGKWGIQYTTPQGGLSSSATENIENDKVAIIAVSKGATAGTTFPINKNVTSTVSRNKQTTTSGIAGISGILGVSNIKHTFLDINGDGLPDNINDNDNKNKVDLNLGYKFANTEVWATDYSLLGISTSKCINSDIGVGVEAVLESFGTLKDLINALAAAVGGVTDNPAKGNSKWEYSFAVGFGFTFSVDKTNFLFIDINGDGLNDKVIFNLDGDTRNIKVALNTGTGFKTFTPWASFEIPNKDNATYNQSVNMSITGGKWFLLVFIPVKIIGNLRGNLGSSVNITRAQFIDMDNDGYVDLVTSDGEDNMNVYYSTLGKEKLNLLKKVTTPVKTSFTIDYELSDCSQQSPYRNWQMNKVETFDGFIGSGVNHRLFTYEYQNPYYDRFDRTSYGNEIVITKTLNTENNNALYRTLIEKYHTNDINVDKHLFKGLKKYDIILDGLGNKYIETYYNYMYKIISTGEAVPDSMVHCFGNYYAAIATEDKYYYEGESTAKIHTQKRYTHGEFGNVTIFEDLGDILHTNDNIKSEISYYGIPELNMNSLAAEVTVKNSSNVILRSRTAEYNQLGQLTTINLNNGTQTSQFNYNYNEFGNIETATYPEDFNGDRKQTSYFYDDVVYTYPVKVTDEMGYSSSATYDYKIGKPTETVDISGNTMYYTYYPDGRLATVQAPYEIDNNIPYTIKFDYWDNNNIERSYPPTEVIPWARTRHYDPANANNEIITMQFSDGLGRIIQTKKSATVENNEVMIVSGRPFYDAFGRVFMQFFPFTEDLGFDSIYYNYTPSINSPHTTTYYDIMDRAKRVIAPDSTNTYMSYGFGNDAFGKRRFKTTQTDALTHSTMVYNNPQGLKTSITDALGNTTKFDYNALGELMASTDPENNVTEHAYDKLGRRVGRRHPDAGITKYDYDQANNLVAMQSQNLIAQNNQQITYSYNYNYLTKITYPQNPENNVYYQYGRADMGNQAGKIIKQQDASGVQTFNYGKLGELIENNHTFVMPGTDETYTFNMKWQYDSWNRLKNITYPDGEEVSYYYNRGGQLQSMSGVKSNISSFYIDSLLYDKYGKRTYILYANGISSRYYYDSLTLRLNNLVTTDVYNNELQSITYTYDDVSNITQISNGAYAINGIGGQYTYNYTYDNIYRLTRSNGGTWQGYNYNLGMKYSPSGNILVKEQQANSSNLFINYSRAYEYGQKPHAVLDINSSNQYDCYNNITWDANGNMLSYENYSIMQRNHCWDEENRLSAVADGKSLSLYTYDAGGERVWKQTGDVQQMQQNANQIINFVELNNNTLYANPYMVATDQEYTKHYYIEGQRIASKIGGGFDAYTNSIFTTIEPIATSYHTQKTDLTNLLLRNTDCVGFIPEMVRFEQKLKGIYNNLYLNDYETNQYFYHSDHLGSSSFITDITGNAIQHLQYLPNGESFINQRVTDYDSRFSFSGKEKDIETNYGYFGARYYNSDINIWNSIDPLSDEYPYQSAYSYCGGRPINVIDPDGRGELDWIEKNGKVMYDSRVTNQESATTLYGDGAKYIPNGYSCTVNENKVQLDAGGRYSINGVRGFVNDEATGLPEGMRINYPQSGRCDYSPINIEDLIGIGILIKGGLKLFGKEAVEESVEIFTKHGAKRIAGATATRGGVLTTEGINVTKSLGKKVVQSDGAAVFLHEITPGRFNAVVQGNKGIVTTMSNWSMKSINRIAKKYGWKL